jgi:hypothetical protein
VSTLRALDLKEDPDGQQHLQGQLRYLPGPVQDVILFCRQHSWRALFAGLRPAIAATAVSQGIYFTVYSILRQLAVVSVTLTMFALSLHSTVVPTAHSFCDKCRIKPKSLSK